MKYEQVIITPEFAEHLLSKNAGFQRKLRDSVVNKYARDMENGKWVLTHQGVALDCKGRLIDGQHRLAAIVKSKVPTKMLLITDSPATAFDHVDIGFARTATDILKAQGEGWITNEVIAVAKMIEATSSATLTVARSPFEIRELAERHKNAIHFVFQNLERRIGGITIAPVLGAIALAYYTEKDRVRLAEFIRLIVGGISGNPITDSLVIRFRDSLLGSRSETSGPARYAIFLRTQRVIKAYMNDERLAKFFTPSEPCYKLKKSYSFDIVEE